MQPQRHAHRQVALPGETVRLLHTPAPVSLRGRRDRALLAVSTGCGLRRKELSALTWEHIQQRDVRPVIVDLVNKRNRVRSVPVPCSVFDCIACWTAAANITGGRIFRAIDKKDRVRSDRMTAQAIYEIIRATDATSARPLRLMSSAVRSRSWRTQVLLQLNRSSFRLGTRPSLQLNGILASNRTSHELRGIASLCPG
jgi:site-specific recombinase XerC